MKQKLKQVTLDGVRLHLRTGEKKLWINGYYSVMLDDTAAFIVEAFIDSCYEVDKEEVVHHTVGKVCQKYKKVKKTTVVNDIHQLVGIINSFARGEIPAHLIGQKKVGMSEAPNRMDLALTYVCNNACPHCYLLENKDRIALTTVEWKKVIDRCWEVGIPQLVFTGGECTLRPDLVELVKYAEKFSTGIISNGTKIDDKLAKGLKDANLDWVQITLESDNPVVHDKMQGRDGAFVQTVNGIRACIKAGLVVNINATITKQNKDGLLGLLDFAKMLNVSCVSTNAIINAGRGKRVREENNLDEQTLKLILMNAKAHAKEIDMMFNWYLPTCYKELNPIELGFGQRCCSACTVNMMVEPSGDVIPCQSWGDKKLGDMLADSWKDIWDSKATREVREVRTLDEKCKGCEYLKICKGGCQLK